MAFWPPFVAGIFMRLRTSSRWSSESLSVTNVGGQRGESGGWLSDADRPRHGQRSPRKFLAAVVRRLVAALARHG